MTTSENATESPPTPCPPQSESSLNDASAASPSTAPGASEQTGRLETAEGNDDMSASETQETGSKLKNEPLPPVDHSQINYPPIDWSFYKEHPDVAAQTAEEIEEFQNKCGVMTAGSNVPKPISDFKQLGIKDALVDSIRPSDGSPPPAIIRQLAPVALSGRDALVIWQAWIGRRLAYMLPLLAHVHHQPAPEDRKGPVALVLTHSDLVAKPITQQLNRLNDSYGKVIMNACGSVEISQESLANGGVDIMVATPGRVVELVRQDIIHLRHVSVVVVDDLGDVIRKQLAPLLSPILQQVRPDRQTLMMVDRSSPANAEYAMEHLRDPIKIAVTHREESLATVDHIFPTLRGLDAVDAWLCDNIAKLAAAGGLLIYVDNRREERVVSMICQKKAIPCKCLAAIFICPRSHPPSFSLSTPLPLRPPPR
ncbi:ATP-dependent RNA helicase ddx42 [Tieghemiomyces parasiticus]|uniref:ATP-dependent RNA helicase ddx42 n=1 Tax=Tieghemiomyces parasiticus TaxID=78921 RepID=A0A9W8A9L8_9FUNG|nr:ATP-dependent RNA helicase ddx42 [Tieghemiomyces parasiticus]